MAVKKSLLGGYTYQDLFDTQEALDTGKLKDVEAAVEVTTHTQEDPIFGIGLKSWETRRNVYASKDDLGSILGQTEAIAANKKRKEEQKIKAQQGFGTAQSILGGSAF